MSTGFLLPADIEFRKVPERDRAGFLEFLNQVGQTASSEEGKKKAGSMARAQDEAEIKREYARLKTGW